MLNVSELELIVPDEWHSNPAGSQPLVIPPTCTTLKPTLILNMTDTTTPAATQQIRIAIVTGGASGIGRSVALRLAADGLDMVINDLPANEIALNGVVDEIRAHGRRAIAFCGDISEEAVVQDLVDKAVSELGGVDVVRSA